MLLKKVFSGIRCLNPLSNHLDFSFPDVKIASALIAGMSLCIISGVNNHALVLPPNLLVSLGEILAITQPRCHKQVTFFSKRDSRLTF